MNLHRAPLLAFLVLLGACEQSGGRGTSAPAASAASDLELVEISLPGPLLGGSPFGEAKDAIQDVERRVRALVTDARAGGLFLRVGPLPGAWVKTAELGTALNALRAAHKPVHCHFDVVDNVAYRLVASHCDRVSMTPAGNVGIVGSALQVFFVRSLLASIGVEAEVLHVGRYKATGDSFILDDMPETMRESLGAVVDELDAALLTAVSAKTGLDRIRAAALVDRGPFDSDRALAAKLVDAVEFDDEARAHAKAAAHASRIRPGPGDGPRKTLLQILEELGNASDESRVRGPRVAVVHLEGPIVDGERQVPNQIRSEVTIEHLRALADDAEVKAVVLAIDSPGGSVIASDRIWHAVRRVAARKPVIASIGPMGASGGYYIASGATEVFALEQSLVGSIGVVSGKANASALLGRLGVNPVTVSRRAHAGAPTLTRAFTDEERAHAQTSMQQHYDRFIRRIVTGRGLDEARVREVAEGRLWTGRAAHAQGLVQTLGGYESALARARTLGQLPADASVSHWPSEEGFLERLIALFLGDGASASALARFVERASAHIPFVEAFLSVLETSPVLAALPYVLEIR